MGGEGVTHDAEVGSMQLRDSSGGYLTTVDVYKERGSGREYYFHNGVKEYVDQGLGVPLDQRNTINRNQ
jgi:hypothetical protein